MTGLAVSPLSSAAFLQPIAPCSGPLRVTPTIAIKTNATLVINILNTECGNFILNSNHVINIVSTPVAGFTSWVYICNDLSEPNSEGSGSRWVCPEVTVNCFMHLLHGIMQPKSQSMGATVSHLPDEILTNKTKDRSQEKMPTLHMQGVTFSYSTSDWVSEWGWQFVLIFLCRLAVSSPSHLRCLG